MDFKEYNVAEDEKAREEMMKIGSTGVPTIVVDGEAVIGFDRDKLEKKLN